MKTNLLYAIILVLFLICGYNSFKLYEIDKNINEPYGTIEELVKIQYMTKNNICLITKPEYMIISQDENKKNNSTEEKNNKPYPHIIGYKDFDGNEKYLANPISYEALESYYFATYQEKMP